MVRPALTLLQGSSPSLFLWGPQEDFLKRKCFQWGFFGTAKGLCSQQIRRRLRYFSCTLKIHHQMLRQLSRDYTRGLMTDMTACVRVCSGINGSQIRKGKAMLRIHTYTSSSIDRQCEHQGMIMPSASRAERLILTCLDRTGSSGHLGSRACIRELE